ncbi:diacylglycerol/lipid kinase family protein [Isobaculum melis]|uniref:Lipid kinase, YegS/Rv2252/BmrU family n=1 Tax=Isobaculum melis TaxID=142588 RepID=A0A1H9S436_9LACT|nr:diacylglycerol kinase family protein [Isobaculum melis]SER79757.1 lipid kinase, YegS/Rv2252/BmrU family [Isobaculum melis]
MNNAHYHIIFNQHAGSGTSKKAWQQVEQVLIDQHILYTAYETEFIGHGAILASEIIQNEQKETGIILVLGGDGTLHEVMNGLGNEQTSIPIAYIPCGSGNDFARGVGISRKPLVALEKILNATEAKTFDIVHYKEKEQLKEGYFVNNIGIGFDAAVVKKTNHSTNKEALNKYKLGSLSYLSSVISVFFKQKPFPIDIEIDGQQQHFEDAYLVTTSNHPYFGGGVPIIPNAVVDDGLLDLIIVTKINFLYFLWLFMMMPFKKHTAFKRVHLFQGKVIKLYSPTLEDGQADGEELGMKSFDFEFQTVKRQFWFR